MIVGRHDYLVCFIMAYYSATTKIIGIVFMISQNSSAPTFSTNSVAIISSSIGMLTFSGNESITIPSMQYSDMTLTMNYGRYIMPRAVFIVPIDWS